MPTYDLASEPWITTPPLSGSPPTTTGLRDLFLRAHEYADAELSFPPASAGLWRLLALFGARITGLDSCKELADFAELRAELLKSNRFDPEEVSAYFDEVTGRLDLFGPRAWLQDPRLGGAEAQSPKTSGINKLSWGRPAGNTQVWLNHTSDLEPRPVPTATAVHHLIATLYYGASGTCTSRTANGVTASNTAAGPLRRSLSFHPVGRNLFESIILNVPFFSVKEGDKIPETPWERDELRDPTLPPEPGVDLAGILTNQFRHAVLLRPSADGSEVIDATVTWGTRSSKEHQANYRPPMDPYQIHWIDDEGNPGSLRADASRAVWRDLDALLRDRELGEGNKTQRPHLFNDLSAGLPRRLQSTVRVRVFGFDQDGQARDRQWFTATTPKVLRWLYEKPDELGDRTAAALVLRRIRESNSAAESVGRTLESTLDRVWKDSGLSGGSGKPKQAPWTGTGMSEYWSAAERRYWEIVHDDNADGPGNTFVSVALKVFDEITDPYRHRPRVAEAAHRNRGSLFKHWTRSTPTGQIGDTEKTA